MQRMHVTLCSVCVGGGIPFFFASTSTHNTLRSNFLINQVSLPIMQLCIYRAGCCINFECSDKILHSVPFLWLMHATMGILESHIVGVASTLLYAEVSRERERASFPELMMAL